MYRISAPGQWASICQSPSAMRLLENIRGETFSFSQYALGTDRFLGVPTATIKLTHNPLTGGFRAFAGCFRLAMGEDHAPNPALH
jgi:hypothetical protein